MAFLLSSIFSIAAAVSAPQGATFVHLFEWKWSDVATECETFLGPKGYYAVQISPPQEHIQGSAWWTRYQPVSYKLVSRSGNESEFIDMVKRCSAVNVSIYADAVINHMASGNGVGVAGTSYGGRNYLNYTADDLHHNDGDNSHNCLVTNYQDQHNVQYCDLDSLPDLCTGCESTANTLGNYINYLKSLGVAGIRVDAAKHQEAGELGNVLQKISGDFFVFQEVIEGSGEAVTADMYYGNGLVTEFGYAYSGVGPNIVSDGKMQYLETLGPSWGLMPSDNAVVFMDNHDTQRGAAPLTYKDGELYSFANIFMLSWPYGYPKVMSSYYFTSHDQGPPSTPVHDGQNLHCFDSQNWVCEHRQPAISNMVRWRKVAAGQPVQNWVVHSADQISFSRGGNAFVAMNRGTGDFVAEVNSGLAPGKYCNIIVSDDPKTCPVATVGDGSQIILNISPKSAFALHIDAKPSPDRW